MLQLSFYTLLTFRLPQHITRAEPYHPTWGRVLPLGGDIASLVRELLELTVRTPQSLRTSEHPSCDIHVQAAHAVSGKLNVCGL